MNESRSNTSDSASVLQRPTVAPVRLAVAGDHLAVAGGGSVIAGDGSVIAGGGSVVAGGGSVIVGGGSVIAGGGSVVATGQAVAHRPRLLFHVSGESKRTANHALQRTGAAVTPAASCLRLSPAAQRSRQPRRSLSLGSLGVLAHHA